MRKMSKTLEESAALSDDDWDSIPDLLAYERQPTITLHYRPILGRGNGKRGAPIRGAPIRGAPIRGAPIRGIPIPQKQLLLPSLFKGPHPVAHTAPDVRPKERTQSHPLRALAPNVKIVKSTVTLNSLMADLNIRDIESDATKDDRDIEQIWEELKKDLNLI